MNFEKIKRIPIITFMYRVFHPSMGTCGICGLPWSNCKHHTIKMTNYEGFFPVCEHCWNHCSIERIKQACTRLYHTWESQGVIPYTIEQMHKAVDRDKTEKGE